MTAYTTIPSTDYDAESPIDVDLMTAIVLNPTAITEGSLGAPRIVTASHDTGLSHWVLLSSTEVTGSAASAISFTGLAPYNDYLVVFENIVPLTDDDSFYFEQGYGATPTWISSGYKYHVQKSTDNGATYSASNSPAATEFLIALNAGTGTNENINGSLRIYGAQSTNTPKAIASEIIHVTSSANLAHVRGSGQSTLAAAVSNPITAMRFTMATGNIAIGSIIKVYGFESSAG